MSFLGFFFFFFYQHRWRPHEFVTNNAGWFSAVWTASKCTRILKSNMGILYNTQITLNDQEPLCVQERVNKCECVIWRTLRSGRCRGCHCEHVVRELSVMCSIIYSANYLTFSFPIQIAMCSCMRHADITVVWIPTYNTSIVQQKFISFCAFGSFFTAIHAGLIESAFGPLVYNRLGFLMFL